MQLVNREGKSNRAQCKQSYSNNENHFGPGFMNGSRFAYAH